jgi:hypothetical protein
MVALTHAHTPTGVSTVTCADAGTTGVAVAIAAAANKPTKMLRMNTSLELDIRKRLK